MLDRTVYEGHWWLPEQPGNFVPGTLTLDESGRISLTTLGPLVERGFKVGSNVDAITGISADGKHITLVECWYSNRTSREPGIEQQRYTALVVAIGVTLDQPQVLKLKSLSFRFTDIEAWVDRNGFTIETDLPEIRIIYRPPDHIEANLPDGYKLKVGSRYTWSPLAMKDLAISERDWITVESPEEDDLLTLWRIVGRLRQFLSLAVGRPVYITELQATSELAKKKYGERDVYLDIQIHLAGIDQPKDHKPIYSDELFLPLKSIEGHLSDTLSSWFERSAVIEPALNLYFGTLYEHTIQVQRHFLFLAQAAETYHRRASDETDLSNEEHQIRIEAILGGVPEEWRSWLEGKLRYSNEISLRTRIKRLVKKFSDVLEGYIDRKSFAQRVVNTRNYLTHYDPDLKDQAASSTVDFLDLIFKLRTILEACFLSELQLTDEEISQVLADRIRDRADIIERNRE